MELDEFTEFADELVNTEVPPVLLKELNLGIVVLPQEKDDGEYLIMGEYITEEIGSHIILYYGSFAEALQGEPREVWEENIRETIMHELQHHIEDLAGNEKLARQEMREEFMRRQEKNTEANKGFMLPLNMKRLLNILRGFFKKR